MKLIIDIPEEDYNGICHLKNEQLRMLPVEVAETLLRIANGTPLDNLKTKIEEVKTVRVATNDAMIDASADVVINPQYRNFTSGLDMAINIINHY